MTDGTENNIQVESITPEIAREYLGFNTHNRNLRSRVVAGYAADMIAGDWLWNGESLKFAVDGTLLDGQHRLAAIAEAGVTVKMLVIRGLPAGAQDTVDGGAKRKFSDVLNLRGEKNYISLATTVRGICAWESGERNARGALMTTNSQLLATLEKHPWVREGMATVQRVSTLSGLPVRVGGLAWWLFVQLDSDDANYFFDRLASDQAHQSGQPIYELRKAISASFSVRGERSANYLLAITIKAWNKYRDGEKVGQLRFRMGGASPESFPEPK